MKRFSYASCVFILSAFLFSCQKELSKEIGTTLVRDSVKSNCRIQQLVERNASSGRAEYAYLSTYDAGNLVSRIVFVDSVSNTIDNSFSVSYPLNKVQIDAVQYFFVASDGKVIEFHGYENPADPTTDKITTRYSYNASSQLIQRTEEYDNLPGQVTYIVDYTYTANNLTKAVASIFNGIQSVPTAEVTYEYDIAKTVKNFIFLNALAPEIFYFQTAVNLGANSVNVIKKTTLKYNNPNNGTPVTNTSNFVNFVYDANGYVQSFEVTGNDFDVAGLYAGKRYTLNYFCY